MLSLFKVAMAVKKVKCGLEMKKLVSVVHENNVCFSKSNFTLKLMVLFEVGEY